LTQLKNGVIDYGPAYSYIDQQWTYKNSVCIDADAPANEYPILQSGDPIGVWEQNGDQNALRPISLECLDEPDWVFRDDNILFFLVQI